MGRTQHTILSLMLLSCLLLVCRGMVWEPLKKVTGNDRPKQLPLVFHCQKSGVTHIFWEEENEDKDVYLKYRRQLPNSQLTDTQSIDAKHPLAYYENLISFQSPDEDQYLLVAYGAYRVRSNKGCTTRNDDSCIEVFFTESFNGGETWTIPVRINRTEMWDTVHRSLPAMVYDKGTGKVWIAYYINMNAGIISRAPGAKTFSKEERLSLYMFGRIMHMGYTVDKAAHKTWLHIVWYEDDVDRTKSIYYSRSSDDAENWTKIKTIVKCYKGENLPTLAIDTQAAEGAIYVQYADQKKTMLLWSTNHGESWETPVEVGTSFAPHNGLAICGHKTFKGKGFSMGPGMGAIAGFVKAFDAGSVNMQSVGYPFGSIKKYTSPYMQCAIKDNGQIVLTAAVYDTDSKEIWLAQGREERKGEAMEQQGDY